LRHQPHKICYVLGGASNLPHAQTHAVVLPYVLAFNGPAAPEAERRIAAAVRREPGDRRPAGPAARTRRPPRALRDYGFSQDAIPEAAEIPLRSPY
jgi:maleylacetate reductase